MQHRPLVLPCVLSGFLLALHYSRTFRHGRRLGGKADKYGQCVWLYVWIGIIAIIKIINIVSGFVVQKRFVAFHSMMNKVTGVLLFSFPLTLSFVDLKYSAVAVCLIATFAAIQEGHFIRTKRNLD